MKNLPDTVKEYLSALEPKFSIEELEKFARKDESINSKKLYKLIQEFTSEYEPVFHDEYESKWILFVPTKNDGKTISILITIFFNYHKEYCITVDDLKTSYSQAIFITNEEDNPTSEELKHLFDEIESFMQTMKKYGESVIIQTYPYKWRTGRIKRKFITEPEKLLPPEKGKEIVDAYNKHEKKMGELKEISVNDYLNTAFICYTKGFGDKVKERLSYFNRTEDEITPELIHELWADQRHGGMLFIEDLDSKEAFMEWFQSRKWEGAHPFEIVYSAGVHGITLYPPKEKEPFYRMGVADMFYNNVYLKMVMGLIENKIPFKSHGIEDNVAYATGDAYIKVNYSSLREETLQYSDTEEQRKQYFQYIEWDKLPISKPK